MEASVILAEAEAAERNGEFDTALDLYLCIANLEAGNWIVRVKSGAILVALGEYESGLEWLRSSVDVQPLNPEPWISCVTNLIAHGYIKDAKQFLSEARCAGQSGFTFDHYEALTQFMYSLSFFDLYFKQRSLPCVKP